MHLAGKAILNKLLVPSSVIYQRRSLIASRHNRRLGGAKVMIKYQQWLENIPKLENVGRMGCFFYLLLLIYVCYMLSAKILYIY